MHLKKAIKNKGYPFIIPPNPHFESNRVFAPFFRATAYSYLFITFAFSKATPVVVETPCNISLYAGSGDYTKTPTAYAGDSVGDRVDGCANGCANGCGNGKLYELSLNFKAATFMPASCKNGDARIYHHGARIVPARISQSHNKKGRGLWELTEGTTKIDRGLELTKGMTAWTIT